ncbi:alpha/beta hydrolase family protein [Actinoplanes sp. RD1]|uniref:alpha/beta hydrolase family protein n=1 Tax=Actinoplanes sp. RD1 TaxID=3064538 RepID=UPI00274142C7|nr:alpha/beta fold hydrolase [Actinoplanes sp. RD1]
MPGESRYELEVDGQSVPVLARYPDAAAPAPVIVFCHGLGGAETGYSGLGRLLAERGHAVLHPRFADAGVAQPRPMLFDPAHWMSRVRRVHAVIDALAEDDKLRSDRVVVAGHSFGAHTAQAVAGADIGLAGTAHPAVAAAVLCSPQGSGDRGLTPRSWAGVRVPLLVVTATGDLGPHGEGLEWRREPYDRSPSPWKHLAVLRGGDHFLGGFHGPGPTPAGALIAAFADRVGGDAEAGAWLSAGPFPELFDHEEATS